MVKYSYTKFSLSNLGHPNSVTAEAKQGKKGKTGGRPQSPVLGHREKLKLNDRGPGGHQKICK